MFECILNFLIKTSRKNGILELSCLINNVILLFSSLSDNCAQATGKKCQNGACLESQCHCNDGFGGKGCEMPDENECKFRPCDVFAHCTNTMGSFFCSCFPGYEGDGFKCSGEV